MPFDATPEKLSLADLSWRLRHPETWPPGFAWDYGSCSDCAMGLAVALAGAQVEFYGRAASHQSWMAAHFPDTSDGDPEWPMFNEAGERIFLTLNGRGESSSITPGMVADAIDEFLGRP